ncbi:MAG: hypothetical protein MMC23_007817 [Stictis urceolatum]|nr:hypothetical protein [Stictis urceolata]
MRALSLLGSYLTFNETNLELVAREGIVSVLKFQIESHCREIGCYGSEADRKTLCDATKYVHAMRRTHGIPELPKNWFTLHQVNMKQESFVSAMIQDAESSPYEIFKQGGLTLIAQPFDMLFCEAVDRAGREASSVSRNLAVRYLSEYIETHNNTPIASGQIRGWSMKYKKGWVIGVLNEIDIMYREQYGGTGIVWSGNEG